MVYTPAGAETLVDTVRVRLGNEVPPFAVKLPLGIGREACRRSPWEARDDTERPVHRSVIHPHSVDRECCAARCAVGKRACLGAYPQRPD